MVVMRMLRSLVLPLVAVAVLAPACSSSSHPSSKAAASGPAAAAGTAITIKNFAFSPNPIKVKAGATITVMNSDGTAHTVTADDKTSFDTSPIPGGTSKTITAPSKPGTYPYHCNIHDYMKGTLVVG